jgi:hypothetical protein
MVILPTCTTISLSLFFKMAAWRPGSRSTCKNYKKMLRLLLAKNTKFESNNPSGYKMDNDDENIRLQELSR